MFIVQLFSPFSLEVFIDTLRKEQSLVEARIEKVRAGQKEGTPRKRYKNSAARIQELAVLYDYEHVNDYLVRIAQNLSL